MADIETRDESQALQIASDALDRYMDATDRELFREGWIAGRDYERQRRDQETAGVMARQGLRLLGCPHYPICATVEECQRVVSG